MKLEYIKEFAKSLNKLAGIPIGGMLNTAFGAGSIISAAKSGKKAANQLGKQYAPMSLKPTSNYTFDAGQYMGKHI